MDRDEVQGRLAVPADLTPGTRPFSGERLAAAVLSDAPGKLAA